MTGSVNSRERVSAWDCFLWRWFVRAFFLSVDFNLERSDCARCLLYVLQDGEAGGLPPCCTRRVGGRRQALAWISGRRSRKHLRERGGDRNLAAVSVFRLGSVTSALPIIRSSGPLLEFCLRRASLFIWGWARNLSSGLFREAVMARRGRSWRANPAIGRHIPEDSFDDNPKDTAAYKGNTKEKE